MRRLIPLAATFFALAAGPAAAADGTFTCVANVGPGGQAMQLTLKAEAGRCPAPGEAIPAQWLVGEPVAVGEAGVAGATAENTASVQTAAQSAPVAAAPVSRSVRTSATIKPDAAVANAAVAKAVAAAAQVENPGVAVDVAPAATAPGVQIAPTTITAPELAGGGSTSWIFFALVGIASLVAMLARSARPGRVTA